MADNVKKYDNLKRQFDENQYEMLIRCSEKQDITKWNQWRGNKKEVSILLKGAELARANLESADLRGAILRGADLWRANLKGADLRSANLMGVDLVKSNLEGADLEGANIEKADLWKVNLKDAKSVNVKVDDQTFIWGCDFNKQTDFTGVHLELARIDPYLKESLRNNIRQIRLLNER